MIDKDLASSLLARSTGAGLFMLSTGIARASRSLSKHRAGAGLPERRRNAVLYAEDQLDTGMALKIHAPCEYLESGGKEGPTGTRIVPG